MPLRDDPYRDLVEAGPLTVPTRGWVSFDEYMTELDKDLRANGLPTGNTDEASVRQILDEQRADRL